MQRFCGKCGCRIEEGGAFCASCGAPVRPWTVEDEQAWRRATGRVPVPNPGNGPEPVSTPNPAYGTEPMPTPNPVNGSGTVPAPNPINTMDVMPASDPAERTEPMPKMSETEPGWENPASKPAPESPKLVINTKKESPEFENYFDTPGDL